MFLTEVETKICSAALTLVAQKQPTEQFSTLRQQILQAFYENLPKGVER